MSLNNNMKCLGDNICMLVVQINTFKSLKGRIHQFVYELFISGL